jgi:hypothetical protein
VSTTRHVLSVLAVLREAFGNVLAMDPNEVGNRDSFVEAQIGTVIADAPELDMEALARTEEALDETVVGLDILRAQLGDDYGLTPEDTAPIS